MTTYVHVDALQGALDTSNLTVGSTTFNSAALAGTANNPGCPTIAAPNRLRITFYRINTSTSQITFREDMEITAYTNGATVATVARGLNGTSAFAWQIGDLWVASWEAEDIAQFSPIATVDLTTQAAAQAATSLATPSAAGLFEIRFSAKITRAATTSSVLGPFKVIFTDVDGNVVTTTLTLTQENSLTTGFLAGSLPFYAGTGGPIQYSLDYTSVGGTTMQYNLHVSVSQAPNVGPLAAMLSFNGRSGAVSPAANDYDITQIANAPTTVFGRKGAVVGVAGDYTPDKVNALPSIHSAISNTTSASWGLSYLASGANTYAFTLPAASADQSLSILQYGTGVITVTAPSGVIYGKGLTGSGSATFPLGAIGSYAVIVCDGTNYFIVAGEQDSGWSNLSLLNSWVQKTSTPQIRMIGNKVYLAGGMNTGASSSQPFTIPAGKRPPAYQIAPCSCFNTGAVPQAAFLQINADGTTSCYYTGTISSTGIVGLVGCSWEVD